MDGAAGSGKNDPHIADLGVRRTGIPRPVYRDASFIQRENWALSARTRIHLFGITEELDQPLIQEAIQDRRGHKDERVLVGEPLDDDSREYVFVACQ